MRFVAAFAFALLVLAGAAHAETAADLFRDGLALIDQGKPAEACKKLEAALKLEPDKPGVLLNLGVCNEKQNKIATALYWFRRALALAAERGIQETENAARERIKALSPKVPTIKIAVTGADDATVTVDGARVPPTSFARLEIDAGPHKLDARAAGKSVAQDIVVDDVPDARQPVAVELAPESAQPQEKQKQPDGYVELDRGATRRHTGILVASVGGGLVLASGALSLIAKNRFDGTDDVDTRRTWKNVAHWGGTSIFAGGVAALAIGIGLYVSAPAKERVRQTTLVPVVDKTSTGVAVGGSF